MINKKYIAIDLGTKTMGIATSCGIISSSKNTYKFLKDDFISAAKYLDELIKKEKYDVLVLGYPINMNNSYGERIRMVDDFIDLFKKITSSKIKIVIVDERLTTRIANNILLEANLSRKKRKEKIDSVSAQVILETYLNKLHNDMKRVKK